jgi:hypothetical protein
VDFSFGTSPFLYLVFIISYLVRFVKTFFKSFLKSFNLIYYLLFTLLFYHISVNLSRLFFIFFVLWVRPPHLSRGYYRLGRTFALSSSHHYNTIPRPKCQTLFLNLLIKFCTKNRSVLGKILYNLPIDKSTKKCYNERLR